MERAFKYQYNQLDGIHKSDYNSPPWKVLVVLDNFGQLRKRAPSRLSYLARVLAPQ